MDSKTVTYDLQNIFHLAHLIKSSPDSKLKG